MQWSLKRTKEPIVFADPEIDLTDALDQSLRRDKLTALRWQE